MFVNLNEAAAAAWAADYRETVAVLRAGGIVDAEAQARAAVTARRGEVPDMVKAILDLGGPLQGGAQ